jgi:hypothetical protein
MSFKKLNNLVGWLVCIIACTVYMITKEKSASFWDCGEFLSGSYKLEVVHSPGAPLFLLLGRMFTMFTDGKGAAAAVNTLSALSSGFTILFLFWSITHFARRIFQAKGWVIEGGNMIAILAAGTVGALAYTFSDTFWFSAVEGEVYALSSFLTALVFWAILKWEDELNDKDNPNSKKTADRWILFIAYIMGLSVGVHLLNLLAIPAIIMVYYYNKYPINTKNTAIAFLIGCVITGAIQYGVIQKIPEIAGWFDVKFVNDFGLPFNSGVIAWFAILITALIYTLIWAKKKGNKKLHLGILSILFIIIGYSSYFQIIIRSNADVPIDMTNPDNVLSLVKYLKREQYGAQPLVFGPYYNSQPTGYKNEKMDYWKGKDSYEELGENSNELEYDKTYLFPRIWDRNDPRHVSYYKQYLGLGDEDEPTFAHNIKFFLKYQMGMMYWRYFLWNYVGRQNDIQKVMFEPDNGNWMSGIKPIDKLFGRGDSDKLPAGVKDSRARNHLYGLPFILGILGLVFHYKHDKRNTFVNFLLFFFTGAAIVIYLNNTPMQPRERDYAYVGSMYAFAIWIGLGVLFIWDLLKNKANLNSMMAAVISFAVTMIAVPLLMASVEWDDHDRSKKLLPPASAKNFLESCDKNAVLFTEGDNDTYPLWYLQEIEGVRTDVRVINLSLLGIDWYIDQLSRKVNEADAVKMNWKSEAYRGEKRNFAYIVDDKSGQAKELKDLLTFMNNDANAKRGQNNEPLAYLPTNLVKITLNGDTTNGGVMNFTLPYKNGEALMKNDLAILNIVAENIGKRPIYFSNTIDPKHYEGLYPFLTQEGLVFKLGTKNSGVTQPGMPTPMNIEKSYDLFMKKFEFGNAGRDDVFYDQTNRRMMNIIRMAAYRLGDELVSAGKKQQALEVLDYMSKNISEKSYPYVVDDEDRSMIFIADVYNRAGNKEKAQAINKKLYQYVKDDITYMNTLSGGSGKDTKAYNVTRGLSLLSISAQTALQAGDSTYAGNLAKELLDIQKNAGVDFSVNPQEANQVKQTLEAIKAIGSKAPAPLNKR